MPKETIKLTTRQKELRAQLKSELLALGIDLGASPGRPRSIAPEQVAGVVGKVAKFGRQKVNAAKAEHAAALQKSADAIDMVDAVLDLLENVIKQLPTFA